MRGADNHLLLKKKITFSFWQHLIMNKPCQQCSCLGMPPCMRCQRAGADSLGKDARVAGEGEVRLLSASKRHTAALMSAINRVRFVNLARISKKDKQAHFLKKPQCSKHGPTKTKTSVDVYVLSPAATPNIHLHSHIYSITTVSGCRGGWRGQRRGIRHH